MKPDKNRAVPVEEPEVTEVVEQAPAATSATAEVVRCTKLNIRANPSPKADVIEVLPAGAKVVVNLTYKHPQYYEILAASGKKGYAMRTYLSMIE